MVVESSGKACGGAFAIAPVESSEATSKLAALRSSQ
jgi:hypothetical protein